MIVLIPSFQPDRRLVDLVDDLLAADCSLTILIVDDGSGPDYASVFAEAREHGAELIGTTSNHGKGHALKLGFRHALVHHRGEDVVCADSDGQHRVDDILRVAERVLAESDVRETRPAIVLGGRRFVGDVPRRSRFGNAVSRHLFSATTGGDVHDTQTGLRGYPAELLGWLLEVPGERFEYELTTLVRAQAAGHRIVEVPIDTVYLDENASSHFRPVVDSVRVMLPIAAFALVGFLSFVIDVAALQVLDTLTGSLLVAVVGARALSATVNFLLNRRLVFRAGTASGIRRQALRYGALALVLLGASYLLIAALTGLGVGLISAKIVAEVTLFAVSYAVQRGVVFAGRRGRATAPDVATPAHDRAPASAATTGGRPRP